MESADAIYVCEGYESSKGTLAEIAHAEGLRIPVYYRIKGLINE